MDFDILISQIRSTEHYFSNKIARTIDRHLTIRNWLLGFYIVEYEQNGEDRAAYGAALIPKLASQLNAKGLSSRNLKLFRQFYNAYPEIGQTVSAFLQSQKSQTSTDLLNQQSIGQTASAQLTKTSASSVDEHNLDINKVSDKLLEIIQSAAPVADYQVNAEKIISNLSFSHLVELVKIDDPIKRAYYEIASMTGVWSVRELKHQISSLNYERSAAAKDPSLISTKLNTSEDTLTPDQLIKSPYVFDFIGLPDGILGSESDLEKALVDDLKNFIMELGHGFCFEAQQKRIVIGGEYFFIDLVFYHRILKCHVIIELKVDEFTHAHAGQLNTYIQYYKANEQQASDNPPIGILLCTNQNQELVQYALGGMDENLFVSEYQTALPSTQQLEKFLKEEKRKL